jgi:hypothetical protein
MSKYSKHLKDKVYRKMTKEVNRSVKKGMKKFSEVDGRSNLKTFIQWCEECGDELGVIEGGILSIAGSDGIDVTSSRIGGAAINRPAEIEQELEINGYYEEGPVCLGSYYYHKPKMTYLEWFNKKFGTNII